VTIYISGPISGKPNGNHAAFCAAEIKLRANGHNAVNPHTVGAVLWNKLGREPLYAEYMLEDIRAMLACDTILLLPGWEASPGARLERAVAEACGFTVLYE